MRARTAMQLMLAGAPRVRRAMQHVFVAQALSLGVLLIVILAMLLLLMLVSTGAGTLGAQSPLASRAWSIDPTPTLRIGHQAAAGREFSIVVGATRLPDGGVLVGDRGDFNLLRFDASGSLVKRSARAGKGPGEIQFAIYMLRCGDSVVTIDSDKRVSIFTLAGEYVRTFRFTSPRDAYRSGCSSAGKFIHYGWERDSETKKGRFRALVPVWISPSDNGAPTMLPSTLGSERNEGMPLPMGREPRVALGRDRAYVASADSMFVRVFALTGAELPPLRAPYAPTRPTPADVAAAIERDVAFMGEKARNAIESGYRTAPQVELLPATRELVVDADDNLWVQHYPRGTVPTVAWTVFSKAGRVLSTVQIPRNLEVFEIGRDYVLGRYTDPEEGVPEVRAYKLKR
ncbi:MAG: hypothetical protein V4617_14255 [Gemmatimonadota bacterium]